MCDSQENGDSVSVCDNSQSVEELFYEGQCSKPFKSKFNKHPWLEEYFDKRKETGGTVTYCKGCRRSFSHRSPQRLIGHYNTCPELKKEKENREQNMGVTGTSKTHKWVKTMIENNLPLKTIESSSFRDFVNDRDRAWKPPSRQELSNIYIPSMSQTLQSQFMAEIKKKGRTHLSIEIDGWEDRNNRSLLGVIATDSSGRKHLLDLRDISLKTHTAAVIVEELIDILKPIPKYAINSIVSDSAANYKKARQDFVMSRGFEHVIEHRCLAHLFNLIGSRITSKNKSISKLLQDAIVIASTISSSSYWKAYFKRLKLKKIKQPTQVRWYSNVNTLVTLVEAKSIILEDVLPTLTGDKRQVVAKFDWVHLDEVLEVLKLVNHCIGCLERKNVSLGEAVKNILEFAKDLFNLTPTETVVAARKAFLFYFNAKKIGHKEFSLYVAAYILDPRNKLAYVTEDCITLAMQAITRVATNSGVLVTTVKSCLADDFEAYKSNLRLPAKQVDPLEWWTHRMIGVMIGQMGLRFAHLKASSANIERTFSTVKYIQSGSRLNFLPSTVIDLARLKIFYQQGDGEPLEDEDESLFQSSFTEDEEQESMLSNSVEEITNLTLGHEQSWIEEEDEETKRNFQDFFLFFDFKRSDILNEDLCRNLPGRISESQVIECVNYAQAKRGVKRSRISGLEESQSEQSTSDIIIEDNFDLLGSGDAMEMFPMTQDELLRRWPTTETVLQQQLNGDLTHTEEHSSESVAHV